MPFTEVRHIILQPGDCHTVVSTEEVQDTNSTRSGTEESKDTSSTVSSISPAASYLNATEVDNPIIPTTSLPPSGLCFAGSPNQKKYTYPHSGICLCILLSLHVGPALGSFLISVSINPERGPLLYNPETRKYRWMDDMQLDYPAQMTSDGTHSADVIHDIAATMLSYAGKTILLKGQYKIKYSMDESLKHTAKLQYCHDYAAKRCEHLACQKRQQHIPKLNQGVTDLEKWMANESHLQASEKEALRRLKLYGPSKRVQAQQQADEKEQSKIKRREDILQQEWDAWQESSRRRTARLIAQGVVDIWAGQLGIPKRENQTGHLISKTKVHTQIAGNIPLLCKNVQKGQPASGKSPYGPGNHRLAQDGLSVTRGPSAPQEHSDKVVQPRPEWKRSGRRAERQDQNRGNDIRNRLQGRGKGGTSVKLLATPPIHHQGCPRRRGSKVRGIAEIGPRNRRENSPSNEYRKSRPKVWPIKVSEMYIGRNKIENGVSELPEVVGTIGAMRDRERRTNLSKNGGHLQMNIFRSSSGMRDESCCRECHFDRPLDVIEKWNGRSFERIQLKDIVTHLDPHSAAVRRYALF
ncbi:hypothetical protein BDP27DRAFT_1371637 [Rhodocollybia butyracea]|uniref:Uncharacterized protein n=1 Tax=Rhodocollybia butyracea TaxID=206335 RepID=A0A9P5TXC0_9AGAR|nr:hypothetical protein BDP27DRAFT_1371637 [Rhodocollybia butyracea]